MAGPQDIHIQVEADAAAATRSSKQVADELTRVVSNVVKLESELRKVLTGNLPAKMQEFARFIKTVETLPGQLSRVSQTAKTLSSGGPATSLNRAAFQGALAGLKNDASLQALTYEREANKVLEARAKIYDRMQGTTKSGTAGYRAGLQSLGDTPGESPEARKAWMARTLAESKAFETDRQKLAQESAIKSARVEADFQNKLETKRANYANRNMRADALRMNREFDDQRKFHAQYERSEADFQNRQVNRQIAADDRAAKRRATTATKLANAPTRDERTAASLQTVKDRFAYQGGAGMFGVQASVLRNYATMGAVLGTLSYVGKSTIEFQTAMKDVQAISTATDTSMRALEKTIFNVGSQSKLSMKDLADGVKILAQAGYSVQQINEMIKPISELAVGSGSTLEQAANVTTSVLSIFDLSVTRTADVTNTLVAGLNQSKLSMEQLSLGIQYAGNIASQGGVQFEELVAALGAASNAGIKSGSTLGTGLRSVIVELENPSKKLSEALTKVHLTAGDVDIKTHGLVQVLKTLKSAGFDSAAAMGSMDVRAAAMYAAISGNLGQLEAYTHSIVGTTAATDAAGIQMDSFAAQWQRLLNAVTQFSTIGGGPVMSTLTMMAGALANLAVTAATSGPAVQVLVTALIAMTAVKSIQYVVGLVGGLVAMARTAAAARVATIALTYAFEGAAAGALALGTALVIPVLIAGLTALILWMGKAAGQQAALTAELEKFKTQASDAAAGTAEYKQRMEEIDKTVEMLSNRHIMLSQNTNAAGAEAEKAVGRFGAWGLQMDASGRNVDGLIAKLIKLRGEMAAVAHQKAIDEGNALAGEGRTLDKKSTGQAAELKAAAVRLMRNGNLSPEARAAAGRVANGDMTLANLNQFRGILQGEQSRLGNKDSTRGTGNALSLTDALAATQSQRLQNRGQREQNSEVVATTGIDASAQGGRAKASINGMLNTWKTRQYRINQIKDPAARNAAQKAEDLTRQDDFKGLKIGLGEQSAELLKNSQILKGLNNKALMEGTSVQTQIEKQFDFGAMNSMVGQPNEMDEAQLRASAERLNSEALTAKKGKDPATYKAKRDKAAALLKQANFLKFMKTGESPDGVAGMVDDKAAAFDEETKRGMMGGAGGARAKASSEKRTAAAQAKALEREIEVTAANLGPGSDAMMAGQKKLADLTAAWKGAKEDQIRAEATTPQETASRLEDFQLEAKKYIDEVLNGNIQAAKDLLAKYALEAADRAGAAGAGGVLNGTHTLDEAMASTQASFNEAMAAALDASDQAFKTKGFDPTIAHDAIEARRKITSDFLSKALKAQLDVLQAQSDKVTSGIQGQQLGIDSKRAGISALSNYYGSRNISDVRRYLGGVQGQKLDIDEARLDVASHQNAYDKARGTQSLTALALAKDPKNAEFQTALNAAQLDAENLRNALEKSKLALAGMTAEVAPFASFSEAATASWAAYADQAGLNKPMFEQVADGLTSVFDNARTSFSTLVTDVLTGAQTMGGAIKGFAVSVLQSMLDLAVQMLANKAIQWVMNTIFTAMNGGAGNTMSAPQMRTAHGGLIRMAGGGPTPNRDSVHIMAEPGEFMMRKSAVDFIGRDNLEQMNSMGNRRVSAMPTLAGAMKRDPDVTNVYVVAPEHRPSIGKNDVIQVITEDMMKGGKTKQLVKQIMMGAG